MLRLKVLLLHCFR